MAFRSDAEHPTLGTIDDPRAAYLAGARGMRQPRSDGPEAVCIHVPSSPHEQMRTVVSPHPDGEDVTDDEIIVITTGADARRVAAAMRRVADDVEAHGVEYEANFA
jgi:hypothetical protein